MEVAKLEGALLDYWVARAEGVPDDAISWAGGSNGTSTWERCCVANYGFCPSRNWEHGGPIVDRERIELRPESNGQWLAIAFSAEDAYGQTPLIAAMRAYVCSKFGDEVPGQDTAKEPT